MLSRKMGRIAEPINGDFGIVKKFGGNWLCDGGSIQWDGKYWVATLTYTHSGDSKGWDRSLYSEEPD